MVNFDLRVTKKVEDSPEFMATKTDTDAIVLEFKLAQKIKIMKTIQIEYKILRDELYGHLMTNLYLVVQAQLITYQSNMDPYVIISTLFTNYFVELFDHLDLTTEDFINHYKSTHGLTTFPPTVNNAPHDANNDDDMDLLPELPVTQPSNSQQAAILLRD